MYDKTVAADYRFVGVWSKPKMNADKSCAVGVEWRTEKRIELGFTVTPKGGETRWVPFLTSRIGLGKIDGAAGKIVWQDTQHALLWHKNKRYYWLLDVESLEFEFVYKPAAEGSAHGQYQLGKMYLEGDQWVERDTDKARLWLEKSAAQGFARAKTMLAKM